MAPVCWISLKAALLAMALVSAAVPASSEELPPDTQTCELSAWSADNDPAGLNVRAGPSTSSRVLGTLPGPFRYRSSAESIDPLGFRTEFRIVGFRAGWFLIEGAEPPGRRYETDGTYPRRHPEPFRGRGWVAASKVGAQYANGGTRMGGLFAEPREDAAWTPAHNAYGGEISTDGGPKRIFACRGPWAEVESHDGKRGWWRSLCSDQVTNCS